MLTEETRCGRQVAGDEVRTIHTHTSTRRINEVRERRLGKTLEDGVADGSVCDGYSRRLRLQTSYVRWRAHAAECSKGAPAVLGLVLLDAKTRPNPRQANAVVSDDIGDSDPVNLFLNQRVL